MSEVSTSGESTEGSTGVCDATDAVHDEVEWLTVTKRTNKTVFVKVNCLNSELRVGDVLQWVRRHCPGAFVECAMINGRLCASKPSLVSTGIEIGTVIQVKLRKLLKRPPVSTGREGEDCSKKNKGGGEEARTHGQDSFWRELRDKGLVLRKERGDGSCFYRAAARQLFGDAEHFWTVRQDVADHLVHYAEEFMLDIVGINDVEAYAQEVRGNRSHQATHLEISCVEEVYNRRIDKYSIQEYLRNGILRTVGGDAYPIAIATDDNVIRVVYNYSDGVGHYDSLMVDGQAILGVGVYEGVSIGELRGRASRLGTNEPVFRIDKVPDDVVVEHESHKKRVRSQVFPRKETVGPARKHRVQSTLTSSASVPDDAVWASFILRPSMACDIKKVERTVRAVSSEHTIVRETIDGSGLRSFLVRIMATELSEAVRKLQGKQWECIAGALLDDNVECEKHEVLPYEGNFGVCTWNINSFMGKRSLVATVLEQHHIAVCMMQETRRDDNAFTWRMPDHNIFEKRRIGGQSRNGVAVLYHKSLSANEIAFESDYVVAADIDGEMVPTRMIGVSIYVPCTEPGRGQAMVDLENFMAMVHEKWADRTIVVGGDMNMKRKRAKHWAAVLGLKLLDVDGSAVTRHTSTGKLQNDIDHLFVSRPELWENAVVMDSVPEGDHWPVTTVGVKRGAILSVKRKAIRKMLPARCWLEKINTGGRSCDKREELVRKVTDHVSFKNLLTRRECDVDHTDWRGPIATVEEVHQYARDVEQACWSAATDAKLLFEPGGSVRNKWILDGYVRKLVRTRVRLYQRFRRNPNARTHRQYQVARSRVIGLERKRNTALFAQHTARKFTVTARGSREPWASVNSMMSPDMRGNSWQPVYDGDGAIVSNPKQIKKAVHAHFDRLLCPAEDSDEEDWAAVAVPTAVRAQHGRNMATQRASAGGAGRENVKMPAMEDITLSSMIAALRRIAPGKAAGPDGVPIDLLKLMVDAEAAVIREKRDSLSAVGIANRQCVPSWAIPEDADSSMYTRVSAKMRLRMMRRACKKVRNSKVIQKLIRRGARRRRRMDGNEVGLQEILDLPAFKDVEIVPRSGSRELVGNNPKSAMAAVYLRLLKGTWKFATIPSCWKSANLVVLPKKGGDWMSLFSKRGISLMNSGLKLIASMGKEHMQEVFEVSGTIIPEQAGFRPKEECVGQIAALFEICRRRMNKKATTYLLFVDFKQAFDKVSHRGLMAKLAASNVDAKFVEFVTALYAGSVIRVRYNDGTLSPPIQLKRGVRQGCPLSPDLFKLYINDIIELLPEFGAGKGISVPGVGDGTRFPGLLFADDLVLAAETTEELFQVIGALNVWAETNHLPVNVVKCGILVVHPCKKIRKELRKALRVEKARWAIAGEVIPIVLNYVYLGVPIDGGIKRETMAKARLRKGEAALSLLKSLLVNNFIPLGVKADAIYSKIVATVMYSVEVWGTTQSILKPMQKLLMTAVRMATGSIAKGAVAQETLLSEIGLRSIESEARGRIIRFWRDSATKETWVGKMWKAKRVCTRGTWTAESRRIVRAATKVEGVNVEASCRENVQAIWDTERKQCGSVTWQSYSLRAYEATRLSGTNFVWSPAFGVGLLLLLKARTGALDVAATRAQRKNVRSFCWCCEDEEKKETILHLIMHCKCWRNDRYELLGPVITATRELLLAEGRVATAANICTLLLGGAVDGTRIDNWMWKKTGGMSVVEEGHESIEAVIGAGRYIWRAQPVALAVAAYLQTVVRKRRQHLWDKIEWLTTTLGKNPLVK